MHVILADIGNSFIKLTQLPSDGTFASDSQVLTLRVDDIDSLDLCRLTTDKSSLLGAKWLVSSVNPAAYQQLRSKVDTHSAGGTQTETRFQVLEPDDVPLPSNVDCRSKTGIDRLLASYAAWYLHEGRQPVITVDAGTAVTIDLVQPDGTFQGGVIFPGFSTSFQSLGKSTAGLPDLQSFDDASLSNATREILIGKSTQTAIYSGVFHSQVLSIRGIVQQIGEALGQPCAVYATGGGIAPILSKLPDSWNFDPHLVLRGLAMIESDTRSSESAS